MTDRYKIEAWPQTEGGMTVGMPSGVKVTDMKTGQSVAVNAYRSQHLNRDAAIKTLQEEQANDTK